MAPEVMLGKPYNQKADVYSFGILLYEIFALELPFQGFTNNDFRSKVFSPQHNFRPKLPKKWPTVTKALLSECWDTDGAARPDIHRIASVLKAEMADVAGSATAAGSSIADRTDHMRNRSEASRHRMRLTDAAVGHDLDKSDRSQRSVHHRIDMDDVE